MDQNSAGSALMLQRLRQGLTCCLLGVIPFAILDLLLAPDGTRLVQLLLVKLIFMGVASGILMALSPAMSETTLNRCALLGLGVASVATALSGWFAHDSVSAPLLCVMLAICADTLLPWPRRYQIGAAAIVGVTILMHAWLVGGVAAVFSYSSAVIVIMLVISVVLAGVFGRQAESLIHESIARRRAIRGLSASEARKEEILKAALDCIVTVDRSGNIVEFNAAAERTFGWKREEVEGRELAEVIVPPEFRAKHREGFNRYVETGKSDLMGRRIEVQALRRDGSEFPLEVMLARTDTDGDLLITAFLRDITDRRLAEEQLRRSRDVAEMANRAKSEFLTRMSHELRTPLNGVIGMADLLRRTNLDGTQREYLDAVSTSADALLGIINDLLDVSRIEAGNLHLAAESFSPLGALTIALGSLGVHARQKGLDWTFVADPGLPAAVRGDSRRFCQVVGNLAENAVKFTSHGGVHIRLRAKSVTDDQVQLEVSVADTGPGIPAAQQATIFEPFAQVDSSLTRSHGGLGLGLAVSAELAKMMDGSLTLVSEPGRGSTLTFVARMTIDARAADTVPGAEVPASAEAPLRILLVEDNIINQQLATAQLKRQGHTVVVAADGRQGVDAYTRDGLFDVVLMDLQMPEMDGFAATRAIRELERTTGRRVPILALTAHAVAGVREECLAAGMDEYLTKPFRPHELIAALRRMSGRGEGLSATRAVEPSARDAAPWDPARALEQAGGDADLLHEIVTMFVNEDCGPLADAIRDAVRSGDAERLIRTAHDLKGVVLNFGATPTVEVARQLEDAGRQANLDAASALCEKLEVELQRLKQAMLAG